MGRLNEASQKWFANFVTAKGDGRHRGAKLGTPLVFGAMGIAGTAMVSGKKSPAQAMKAASLCARGAHRLLEGLK